MKRVLSLGALVVGFVLILTQQTEVKMSSMVDDMTFTRDGTALIINGETQNDSLVKFKQALSRHPRTKTIILDQISGSENDDVNLKIAKHIRKRKLNTHLTHRSVIESGGIELFMGGVVRTMERGARIGVHSWSDDDDGYSGRDLAKDHPDHKPYIKTYMRLGIPKSFYWFTLQAAPPEDMYFMTEEELLRFNLITEPVINLHLS